MYISETTRNKLNNLLTMTFQMNSFMDNIAYNIGAQKLVIVEKVFHQKFAHAFPMLADQISDEMLALNCRPIRGPLNSNDKRYDVGDIVTMFNDVLNECAKYRVAIIDVIDVADMNNDYEIKIFLEEFLLNFVKYLKQAETWQLKAIEYDGNAKAFDHDFEAFSF